MSVINFLTTRWIVAGKHGQEKTESDSHTALGIQGTPQAPEKRAAVMAEGFQVNSEVASQNCPRVKLG